MISKHKLHQYLVDKYGKVKLRKFEPLGKGVHGTGYLVEFEKENKTHRYILKTLFPKDFGHDYPSDRAQVLLLANRAYNQLPKHVRSIDVVGVAKEKLLSVGDANEFFILMHEVKGKSYFSRLDEIKARGSITQKDKKRAIKLSHYLAEIHSTKHTGPVLYRRRIRDLVGHGECIMGIFDTYPEVDFISPAEMIKITKKAVEWWGKLRDRDHRLCVVHGDYHPGNIWWRGDDFVLLDRSRGIYGEPADDVSCLSINYLFYALLQHARFEGPFKELFYLFFNNYLHKTGDKELLEVIQPWYTFRAIVIANPLFYPKVSDETRRKLINFAINVLGTDKFVVEHVNEYLLSK